MCDNKKFELMHRFVNAEKKFCRLLDEKLNSIGVYSTQMQILMYISDRKEYAPSQKDISQAFDISPAAVAVSLRKLEKAGLVLKNVFDKDNRVNNVSLTDKGNEKVEFIKREISDIADNLFSDDSENEVIVLENLLSKLQKIITDYKN